MELIKKALNTLRNLYDVPVFDISRYGEKQLYLPTFFEEHVIKKFRDTPRPKDS